MNASLLMNATLSQIISPAKIFYKKYYIPISSPVRVFIIYLIALGVYVLSLGNYKEFFVVIQALFLTIVPRRSFGALNIKISVSLECSIAFIILGTLIFGELFHLYDEVWWWDMPFHLFSGFIVCRFLYLLMLMHVINEFPSRKIFTTIFPILGSIGISGLWEVYEFTIDSTFGTLMQPNGSDTMYDLVAGTIGAIGAAIFANKK